MKIICIGRNYAEHAKELNNPVPERPVVFHKPASALLVNDKPLYFPEFTKDLHHELEIVLKIGKNGKYVQPEFADDYYPEIGLGIDFTARDLQSELKKKGQPWEIAKGFDGSAVLGKFVPLSEIPDTNAIEFELHKNGEVVQRGNTRDLLFSFNDIIVYVSQFFKLQMGDLIYTGTPAGVGPVQIGDVLEGFLQTKSGTKQLLRCEIK
ncbi:fumarylacetoacetate hydrolase family protein [Flavilitoribacter nigricans]|uniref:2-hydroxyhepta-2,4-diene-1,7-dioate isomerase n=1 Tax=Flavilitoribacter nigricans (strain ATCC 23147 / DSM 23189 / NBRC 102662 / NCIMB 1420 / SS-2) TaxID=1122177 RepID=A0A2D0NIB6_FLAN2|nr:fumarylacetoacetate hydrolase family protein [Flavilitoribacter nigricans]PHN08245.1 2-hydroxyhepta-2,4-diene-1,7-dioate isomerase [Flavilitoribacter nigricans DSM 23189 = NBRC 102662]